MPAAEHPRQPQSKQIHAALGALECQRSELPCPPLLRATLAGWHHIRRGNLAALTEECGGSTSSFFESDDDMMRRENWSRAPVQRQEHAAGGRWSVDPGFSDVRGEQKMRGVAGSSTWSLGGQRERLLEWRCVCVFFGSVIPVWTIILRLVLHIFFCSRFRKKKSEKQHKILCDSRIPGNIRENGVVPGFDFWIMLPLTV